MYLCWSDLGRLGEFGLNLLFLNGLLVPNHLDAIQVLLRETQKLGQERRLIVVLYVIDTLERL